MKKLIFIAAFMAAVLMPFSVSADDSANIYAYLLNDYITTYGAYSTENAGEAVISDMPVKAGGVVYAQLCDFDFTGDDYLVIYFVKSDENTAACHIWKYNDDTKTASKAAVIEKPFMTDRYETSVFSQGIYNGRTVIEYSEYNNDRRICRNMYTIVDSSLMSYITSPKDIESEVGIMDYNICRFHSGIDVSDWNGQLTDFFDILKDKSADSVTFTDKELSHDEKVKVSAAVKKCVPSDGSAYSANSNSEVYNDIDILGIKGYYTLGDDMAYVLFSTDKAEYNWAMVKNNNGEVEVMREKADCIPLSDSEITRIASEYGLAVDETLSSPEPSKPFITEKLDTDNPKFPIGMAFVGVTLVLTIVCISVMLRKKQ